MKATIFASSLPVVIAFFWQGNCGTTCCTTEAKISQLQKLNEDAKKQEEAEKTEAAKLKQEVKSAKEEAKAERALAVWKQKRPTAPCADELPRLRRHFAALVA